MDDFILKIPRNSTLSNGVFTRNSTFETAIFTRNSTLETAVFTRNSTLETVVFTRNSTLEMVVFTRNSTFHARHEKEEMYAPRPLPSNSGGFGSPFMPYRSSVLPPNSSLFQRKLFCSCPSSSSVQICRHFGINVLVTAKHSVRFSQGYSVHCAHVFIPLLSQHLTT